MHPLCSKLENLVLIDGSVGELGVFIAYSVTWFEQKPIGDLRNEIDELVRYVESRYRLEELKSDPVIRAYRDFYWRIKIDPTKTRPSSEALIRRVLRGKGFPLINPVVDAGNIASTYTRVPIGLYDLSRINPPLTLTVSRGGEVFKPIGGSDTILEPGVPILIDSDHKILHLYPHRDSRETCITEHTREILIIGAGVPGVEAESVRSAVSKTIELHRRLGAVSCDSIVTKQ